MQRFKLQESNTQRQQADEEIFASKKLVAQQKVKIQEGIVHLMLLLRISQYNTECSSIVYLLIRFIKHGLLHCSELQMHTGDTFLKTLQDKIKVSDVYQETLQKEISTLETTVIQCEPLHPDFLFNEQIDALHDELSRSSVILQ